MSKTLSRSNYSRAAIQGTAWRYLTFFSGKLMTLVSIAFLARLLSKDDFGVVGYAITAMGFFDIISDMGIGPALIYYPEEKRTSSTTFWLNIILRLIIFALAWILAPAVALYFRDERATQVLRILSISYPIGAIGSIHENLLKKKLEFNKTFMPEFFRSIVKGGASIVFALIGFGYWSIVLGRLAGEFVGGISYWISLRWKPDFTLDISAARALLGYGTKYVSANIVAIILLNLDYLLVGRFMGAVALGVYTLAFRLPDLIILQFARTLSGVLFPIYTKMREKTDSLAHGYFLTTRYISLVTIPIGLGTALVAKPITLVLLSDKWLEAVPVVQGLAIYSMLLSLSYNAGSAYKATGSPQIITWLGIARLALLFPALWWAVAVAKSTVAVSWMHATVAFISAVLNFFVATRILSIPMKKILEALSPPLLSGLLMAVFVLLALKLTKDMNLIWQLVLSISLGGIVYIGSLWLLNRDVINEAQSKILKAMSRG